MESVKELAGMAAITLLFSLLTWIMVDSYMEEYDISSAEPENAIVVEKSGAKSLFRPPSYYVRVILPGGEESPYLNRISKSQIEEIQIGDSISGYSTGSKNFSTIRDFIFDSLFYLFAISIFGFLAFCCLVALVLSIPGFDRLEKKTYGKRQKKRKKKRRRKRKGNEKQRAWRIVGVVLLIFSIFFGRFLWNFIRKLQPIGKTETEAMIFDRFSDTSYRKYEDSIYELTISFQDQAGHNIQLVKDVTRHTYQQYDIGDKLPIVYRNADPYDVFVRGASIWDVIQTLLFWESFVYLFMIAVTVFAGWVFFNERRKDKENFQEQVGKGKKKS
ncbi:DUF3592 domain-containing protein [Sporosarcina obsidiansis]|uniref:DUF3592 domain-containing protein n=1 Tax=Sporosarcina obsidiansis TaxID=2660748 RepID=UPI00129A5A8E|nr:DUF3592 domain-containing protein [Sporosarcina obsidiansis]